ncbi:17838_t:CDS:2 [Racocetra persica]|uniref:17838_t:CDS:1 n=1 Tax=Racocetra persica TaxID=160502 RepID=A0ACA9KCH3_9GLOM|nr:17838_t:CDS:2 [Racocetra persica]
MADAQKKQSFPSIEHKKKILWGIFAKLDQASKGCGELDLPLFGEILLSKLEKIESEFEPNNVDVSYQINEIELEQRKKIEAIIKSLFPTNPPTISFPESSINPETGDIDWG